jgi:formate hydrogenlyase subunit 6/NADH:ubiquinone oxidoreductase subunit I
MLETVVTALRNAFSKPITVPFPHESIPFAEGYRGRHEFDPNSCISCGMCQKVCPNKAIEMIAAPEDQKVEFPKTYPRVDLGKCCFCGLCEDICPKGALKLSQDVFLSTFDPGTAFVEPFSES